MAAGVKAAAVHFSEMFFASKRLLLNLVLEEQSTTGEVIRGCYWGRVCFTSQLPDGASHIRNPIGMEGGRFEIPVWRVEGEAIRRSRSLQFQNSKLNY